MKQACSRHCRWIRTRRGSMRSDLPSSVSSMLLPRRTYWSRRAWLTLNSRSRTPRSLVLGLNWATNKNAGKRPSWLWILPPICRARNECKSKEIITRVWQTTRRLHLRMARYLSCSPITWSMVCSLRQWKVPPVTEVRRWKPSPGFDVCHPRQLLIRGLI